MNCAISLVLTLAAVGQAQQPTTAERLAESVRKTVAESNAEAQRALKQLEQLATRENFKSLGFESLEEVKQAQLGNPLPVIIVRLDELRAYKDKADPYPLLHPIPKVIYAVNVDGNVRSCVELEKLDGKWEGSSYGMSASAKAHAAALKNRAGKDEGRMFFVVKVLALNKTYLAYQADQGARFIEVHWDDQRGDVESRPAADVLAELVKLAKEHDGNFR